MSKTTDETIRVSDCVGHHGGLREIMVKNEETGKFEPSGKYMCSVCGQPCKVLELLVEKK